MGRLETTAASDAELLRDCGERPEAFGLFYRRHVEALLAYLHRRTGRAELAADLCAETFARALERHAQFDPQRGPARAWLFMLAGGLLVDSFRRGQVEQRARRRLGLPARELTDRDLERIEEIAEARSGDPAGLVADLPPEQREAVLARIVDERSYAEIADELKVSQTVVRQRVSRGLSTVRARLQEREGR
ncbi:RNA polymerase sigma factor [Conexibacter sp. JD483]|uniref:RNA polymerase sigma factor n=1 Tax=unclassified Conexibacter TaxID=2627773 RepID=UPI002718830D|nr:MULTISPECIES: RNA polymerase sigma factor [unclassified Conexibacter]MDO8187902.1 RNA polymerase sigma factor [Conexibacter sp. CPCC 205706]MDO8198647.1 RNA polymerase sigma factor [Conexibacter sp. CPCC 205762]MDR9369687.1 RNA polymerase sigma factor [Conexibacter sp. JD483]